MDNVANLDLFAFEPRDYQIPVFQAIEGPDQIKKVVLVWNRRAGKDLTAFQLAIRHMLREVIEVYYVFPTFAQARRSIYESISNGRRIIDYLPEELIDNRNDQTMRIRLKNGSLIRWCGSNKWQDLKGGNPKFIIFSEFATQDYRAYSEWAKPILSQNGGIVMFVSTPFGKNHLWNLANIAQKNPDTWFHSYLTLADTKQRADEEEILEKDIQSGEISRSLAMQEYYCSYDSSELGFIYAKQINELRLNEQIGKVPYDPDAGPVHVVMDIGWNDTTFILWYQALPGGAIHIINCFEKNKEPISFYAKLLKSKESEYLYGCYFGPHDLKVHEQETGLTRLEFWKRSGIPLRVLPNIPLRDGIEAVRCLLPKVYIDEVNCALLITCLERYEQQWDEARQIYKNEPLHNKYSNGADAMRYLALSIPKIAKGLTPEDLERNYREAVYGDSYRLPKAFRRDEWE